MSIWEAGQEFMILQPAPKYLLMKPQDMIPISGIRVFEVSSLTILWEPLKHCLNPTEVFRY